MFILTQGYTANIEKKLGLAESRRADRVGRRGREQNKETNETSKQGDEGIILFQR